MMLADRKSYVEVGDAQLRLVRLGAGRPILYLHPEIGFEGSSSFIAKLSELGEVFAPTHPGYGEELRPKHLSTVDDLAYLYLRLIEKLNLNDVLLVGCSIGGWIAAEMAIKGSPRISGLVLVSPVGIRPSDASEICDIFSFHWNDFLELQFHDSSKSIGVAGSPTESELRASALAREATALYAWMPYMHNPKLSNRLQLVSLPSLCVWGNKDAFTSYKYAAAFSEAVHSEPPRIVENAGHYPHIEKPDEVFAHIEREYRSAAL